MAVLRELELVSQVSVRGEPQPPETMGGGLAFPDGIGVYTPKKK